ncbi:MAG TPA: hypothetical protein PKA27_12260 [Fimbriimonadaceae bacterium]|nr:hypothetical protein [Fimbriimonadaceae bacterium]
MRVSNLFRHDATTANKMCDGLLARITASGDIWLVLFEVKENRTGQAMKQVRCGHCFFEYVLSIYASVESGATKIKDVQYVVLGIGMPTKAVIGYKRDDPCKPEGIRTVYLSPQGRVSVASLFAP